MDAPVFLYPMLQKQSSEAAHLATAAGGRDFALAVKQCLRCNAASRCSTWLESAGSQGFEAFCPNAGYVSRMRELAAAAREWA